MTARGFGMIEVLVAMIIIAVGLLGLAGLQARAQRVELESYQRVQALILVDDMAQRVRANREAARCYEITDSDGNTSFIGMDNEPAACSGWGTSSSRAIADADLEQWDNLLEGSAETRGTDNVGGMTGARGCIAYDGSGINDAYTISVAWQGEVETQAPTPTCATGEYGNAKMRRVVTRTIEFPELD